LLDTVARAPGVPRRHSWRRLVQVGLGIHLVRLLRVWKHCCWEGGAGLQPAFFGAAFPSGRCLSIPDLAFVGIAASEGGSPSLPRTRIGISALMKWLKGSTARDANRILGRTGTRFWQDESYDRYLRDSRQLNRTVAYIEENPVSAGLLPDAGQWPWSSAGWQTEVFPTKEIPPKLSLKFRNSSANLAQNIENPGISSYAG